VAGVDAAGEVLVAEAERRVPPQRRSAAGPVREAELERRRQPARQRWELRNGGRSRGQRDEGDR
jgi:hypothetical protein